MIKLTTEQLTELAGLGPWRALATDPAEGVDCFWIKGQLNLAMRGFSDEIASVNGSQNDSKRQTNAALIAAAPDLAAALLAKEAEVERLRAALQEVEVECNGHFNGDLTAEEALDNIRKELAALEGSTV